MAGFSPSKKTISDFNNGQKYRNGVDTPNADDFNGVIESQLWTQSLATNQPNIENVSGSGTPFVSIEQTENGTPRFKFENLGGGATQNGDLSIIATFNITEANTTITLKNLVGMTSIDWGDGTTDSNLTHTYTAVGEYTAKIYGVTYIEHHAFEQCSNLTSVFLSNSITGIGKYAFFMTKNLTYLTIPDSVTVIREGAISVCGNLKRLTVGKGIKEIEKWNIVTNTPLEVFEIEAYTPPIINQIETSHLKKIIVPLESLEAYKTAEGWSGYAALICSYVYTTDRNKFVKEGITQNTETLTDEEKAKAQLWLGITALIEKLKADNNLV